jgi:pSer/pThr/pTyr-binding forkhead associated (FHA) protein
MGTGAARLEVVAGNATGMSIVVDDELLIGRHAEGQGRLADDQEISRTHARVTVDASNFCAIEDLGSTNGTFVNGLRISAPQTLSEGDTIELGGTTLVVRELPRTEPAAAPSAPRPQPTIVPATDAPGPPTAQAEPAETAPQAAAQPAPETAPRATQSAPETAPQAAAESAPAPPQLDLRVELDFAAHEVNLFLDDDSEPVRLVYDGDAWRLAPSTAD